LCDEYPLEVVCNYITGPQDNAEFAVRKSFKQLAEENPDPLEATDSLNNSKVIRVKVAVNKDIGSVVYDLAGSGPKIEE
jgi:N-methylhydantoinase B/oxoprolinase/acetone carboxylase alpha subunit